MKKTIHTSLIVAIVFTIVLNNSFSQNISSADEVENQSQTKYFPAWFDSVKLGIMIHFGLYSIPSYSGKEQYAEWFYKGLISNDTARINFQKRVFGTNFSYFDYMQLFKAELFDANQWVDLFKISGAGYIVFSSKHHDGFCLWDTKTTNKNSMQTPAHRDFLKELKTACKSKNIRFGLYYSLMEWDNPYFNWTVDSVGLDKYVDKYLIPQFKELVDMYKPSIVFADGDWDFDYKSLRSFEMVNYLTNKVGKSEVIVNNRWGKGNPFGFLTPEYSSGIKETFRPWSECRSLARSFGLNRNASLEDYLSAKDLIKHFVQLVSLGGGLMLNVAPASDGHIPLLQQERLVQLGEWLSINGEAIYGSKPYKLRKNTNIVTTHLKNKTINFDWVRNAPVKGCSEDEFSIDWQNTYTPKQDESLSFTLDADDVADICIYENNNLLYCGKSIKNTPHTFTFNFKQNKIYKFNIHYEEYDVDAHLKLLAQRDNSPAVAFEGDSLWSGQVKYNENNMYATSNNGNLYIVYTAPLTNSIRIPLDYIPKKDMRVCLLGSEDKILKWEYNQGELTIELSNLCLADIKSKYAYTFKFESYLNK
ncbi:MAG: alpha-L-fucosidase [Bacteroidales bacterium]